MPYTCIDIPFADGGIVRISAIDHGLACYCLQRTAQLLKRPLQPDDGARAATIILSDTPADDSWENWSGVNAVKGLRISWRPAIPQFYFQFSRPSFAPDHEVWTLRRICHLAVFSRVLSADVLLVHGAILRYPDLQTAAVIFGESGMGKSTASRRFVSQGGEAPSDDKLVFCRLANGEYTAQPLPTWSAIDERDISVDFANATRVGGLLNLQRGHDDEIYELNVVQWRLGITSSFGNALAFPKGWLPAGYMQRLMLRELDAVSALIGRFGHLGIRGDLNGHLYDHLRPVVTGAARP